jgi:ribosomal protein S18 acetylase RimI-like enzyme
MVKYRDEKIPFFEKTIVHNGKNFTFRNYNLSKDNVSLVANLFTKMNNEQGLKELFEGDISTFLNSENNFRLVAECESEIVATITLMKDKDFNENKIVNMYAVVTKDELRGSGLSGKFLDFAVIWVQKIGGSKIVLGALKENIRAQKFYEKKSFKKINELDREIVYQFDL